MSLNDMLKSNKPQGLELKIDKILAEIGAAIPQGKTVDVDGQTHTADELVKKLQSYKSLFSGPRETRAALRQMVEDRKHAIPEVSVFLNNLLSGFVSALGRSNPAIEKLGFPPRKKARSLTVEEKLRKAALAGLTRKERNTLGPRQKENLRAQGEPTIVVAPDHTTVTQAPPTNGPKA